MSVSIDEPDNRDPIKLVWRDNSPGGLELWAEYDRDVNMFWLYADEAKTVWIGDADDLADVASWAEDALHDAGVYQLPDRPC